MAKKKQINDWGVKLKKLFKVYEGKHHPIYDESPYRLLVKIILSARATDAHVIKLSEALFREYPTFKALSKANPEALYTHIKGIISFVKKAKWIVGVAKQIRNDANIPKTMKDLTDLPGVGRKSANVFMSETGLPMEGVVVDLHTLRVAPRLGIASGDDAEKVEQRMMEAVPQKYWRELGLSLTLLGREICRPTDPKCMECPAQESCNYYSKMKKT